MLIKCLGAGIVLVLASLSDAFAETVISEDQEFRILSGPVWTDPQNFAFSAADLKGGARNSDEIGVYIAFAGNVSASKCVSKN